MHIDKAIELIQMNLDLAGKKMPPDIKEALNLSIEALKAVKWDKTHHYPSNALRLPGENNTP